MRETQVLRDVSKMRRSALLFSVILAISSLGSDTGLQEQTIGRCRVLYPSGSGALAKEVGKSVAGILPGIQRDLGVDTMEPVTVRLAGNFAAFREALGSRIQEWSLAVARLDRNEIVVRADRLDFTIADSLVPMLRHELCHLALYSAERGRGQRLPLWFHEGVACYVSGRSLFTNWAAFDVAAGHGSLIPLSELREHYPEERSAIELAYLQSEDFIRFLVSEHSRQVLRWILDEYRKSGDFEAAVEEATRESLESLEQRWREHYRSRFPWLRTLWHATTLFGLLAIATILIYYVRRARARRVRLQWEQEDWRLGSYLREAEREFESDAETSREPGPWQ